MAFALFAFVLAAASAAQAPAPAQFGWFGELAGSCWQGDHPGGAMRDRQCYSTQFGRFLRGTIELSAQQAEGAGAHKGDSVFAWDPARERLLFYFWGSDGQHGVSEGYYEGGDLVFPAAPASAGQAPGRRTVWRRIDEDSYRVTVQTAADGNWSDRLQVVYRRVPDS